MNDIARKTIAIVCLVLSASGCSKYLILDRLDTFVLIGFSEPKENLSDCIKWNNVYRASASLKNCGDLPAEIIPNDSIEVWALAADSRNLSNSISGKSIIFQVVDRDGLPVGEGFASIQPGTVVTGSDGLSQGITFTGMQPGAYRIKGVYEDRSTTSYSYSPYITVISK